MKLYLDTSTEICSLKIDDYEYNWASGKDLAEGLHQFIREKLSQHGGTWQDITEITFFSGPGSFTGLRIGATVVNTLANELGIPLYNHHGKKLKMILPEYGRGANITIPK